MGGLIGLALSLIAGAPGSTGLFAGLLWLTFGTVGWISSRQVVAVRQHVGDSAACLDDLAIRESIMIEPPLCLECGQFGHPASRSCVSCGTPYGGTSHG